jgi:hypothetical protein
MRLLILSLMLLLPFQASASSLAGSIGLFVYPPEGKTQSEREQDDYQCYDWAKGETRYDPMNSSEPQKVEADPSAKGGSGFRGALRGAARGAVIGEIADDDASQGAQLGAAAGMMRARSASRQANQKAADSQNAANQQAYAQDHENFKKAMSTCLQARGYSVT